jgi:RNA polymerase sigma-70 factor (ECF subfamily)
VSNANSWNADAPPTPLRDSGCGPAAGKAQTPTIRQIVEEYSVQVWRALRYCGVAQADLHDACQDVFVVIYRKLGEFEHRSSLGTWVYGICMRVASSYRRSAHRRREDVVAETPDLPVHPTQLQEVEEHRVRERLLAALDKLDAEKREVFVLFEIEERPMAEIAALLGCPLRTVYSRLEAARKELARAWHQQDLRGSGR